MRYVLLAAAAVTLLFLIIGVSDPASRSPDPPADPWFQEQVVNNPLPVIVDFYADWCGPCKIVSSQLARIEQEFDNRLAVVKVDVVERPELAEHYNVAGLPMILLMERGQVKAVQMGAGEYDDLRKLVERHFELSTGG